MGKPPEGEAIGVVKMQIIGRQQTWGGDGHSYSRDSGLEEEEK